MKAPATAFRAHNPLWAYSPLSGIGAARHGGRFNRVGVSALYLSLRYETAVLEATQGFDKKMQPLTIVQYDIDCVGIVDLTDTSEMKRLGMTEALLRCGWMSLASQGASVPTWEMADRLISDGAAGILVRSFAPGVKKRDTNLVLWRWGKRLPFRVRVVDDDNRLRDPAKK